ncbi:hypothetical protein EKO27_g8970 [Xylaria grammica]|uniref:Uncharacterized protein n=1 Tax=Xylaria grammica TaxID=363999 RepID=A0A439CVU3_9PEZI|nr:hypothetical protein EKO27_g8970 [Xylaria grammica]
MGTPRQSTWREGLSRISLCWRINDLRHLAIFALLAFTISLLLFEAHREFRGATHDHPLDVKEHSFPDLTSLGAGRPKITGQCTTWPVGLPDNGKSRHHMPNVALQSFAPPGGWKKPDGIVIKALQNLAVNGGYLDEIWFMIHTDVEDDLTYLVDLIQKRPQYRVVVPGNCQGSNYDCMWNPAVEENTIYVKSTTIFPLTGVKHYYAGAIHPFLPDPNDKPSHGAASLWHPGDFRLFPNKQIPKFGKNGTIEKITEEVINKHIFAEPPYEGHPWLLLQNVDDSLLGTPMGINQLTLHTNGAESVYGAAWKSWMISAQQQYSLLRNLELNSMWRYHFGTQIDYPQGVNSSADRAALKYFDPNHLGPGAEQLYDTQYIRYNLNFVALWGHDIRNALPIGSDDEQEITATIPKRLQRPFVIDTRAVVGHLSFYPQHDGIRQTDLLDRWRAFANDMICTPFNQKKPFDQQCPGY